MVCTRFNREALMLFLLLFASPAQAEPSKAELVALLETVDSQQRNTGDFHAEIYMEQNEQGKPSVAYEAHVFRRSADERFMILFTNPKASAGQGYLRVEQHLWFYDPKVGKWERRTDRERIGGTGSRRTDFDESRLSTGYNPAYVGEEKLGAYNTIILKLTVKPGQDVAFPVVKVWIDRDTNNVLKRQDFAVSGRLLRTGYYPKWKKVFSQSKGGDVWFPEETRLYDEVQKETSTIVQFRAVDVEALDANTFTKAWLESKSR